MRERESRGSKRERGETDRVCVCEREREIEERGGRKEGRIFLHMTR